MSWRYSPIVTCARQELLLAVRSRWTLMFAVIFAALALLVASSGYILSGGSGMQDFARTAASLLQLVLLLVPLASLIFGVMALTPESGAAELLFSQPVSREAILLGKLAGLFLALVGAEAVGFGVSGLMLFSRTGSEGVGGFLGVAGGAAVLTAVFLSVAALISGGGARQRARSLAVALACWFVFVLLFDVAALGIASLLPSGQASRVLIVAAMINPVDAVRTATLLAVQGTTAFGAASLAFLRFTSGARGAGLWLGASMLLWIIVPAVAAAFRLKRADL